MKRRFIKLTKRLFSQQQKPASDSADQPVKLQKFDVFDYAGHKYSYEIKKNFGKYDIQQIWGDRVVFANDKQTLKQKRKDTFLMYFLLTVFFSVAFVKYRLDKEMLNATEEQMNRMYKNFDK